MRTQPEQRRRIATLGIPVILALTAVLSMLVFQYKTAAWTKEWAFRVLDASAQEQTATLDEIFNGRFSVLETFANSLASQTCTQELEDIRTRMNAIVEASDFKNLAIAGTDGIAYTNDGLVDDSSDRLYITQALAGHRTVQKLKDSRLYEKNRLILSVPIRVDGKVAGVVMGSFSDTDIQRLLISTAFSGSAYSFLCDPDGNIIVGEESVSALSEQENVLDLFSCDKVQFWGTTTLRAVESDLQNGRGGLTAYSIDGEKRYAVYQPVGINDWYLFNVVPSEVVDETALAQKRLGTISIGVVGLCAILLLAIMALQEKRRLQELKRLQQAQLVRYRTDPITGLLNAQGFSQMAEDALRALPETQFCAMLDVGIVNFNQYNVCFGTPAGDAVLRNTALTLLAHCRVEQPCARISGDRFTVLVTDCADQQDLLERIVLLDNRLHAPGRTQQLLMNYGVYVITDRTLPLEELCVRAVAARIGLSDTAQIIGVYDQAVHQRQIEDAQLLENMDEGLRLGQFVPYYQPKCDANTQRIVGAEALVRWICPDGRMIPPDRFIGLFEQNGLIAKLDRYIFEQVCKKLKSMPAPIPISVNFSRAHLHDPDFPDKLLRLTRKYAVAPSLLEIELTETAFFDQREVLMKNMNRLRQLGFLVSIDDFGSGYSSLNLLKDIAFDTVKIDREFLSETAQTQRGKIVIEGIFALTKALKVQTVAEGVETREQLEFLRKAGCELIQGYYFSPPVPEAAFDKLLQAQAAT